MEKIAFYIDNMNRGGAQRVMTNLCEHYSKKGVKVILINDYPSDGKRPVYDLSESIQRVYLQTKYEHSPIKNNISRLKNLRNTLKSEKPDLILSFLAGPNIRVLLATIGLKQKVVVSVRNDPNVEYSTGGVKKALVSRLFNRAEGCVFQTNEAKAYFSQNIQNRSKVILNPVDDRFYRTSRTPNIGEIVTAGRLDNQKRHDILIDAFAKVAEDHPQVNLIIYGEGPLRTQLEEQIRVLGLNSRISLPGNVPNLEEKLATASVFVLSSDYEGMPNALMEAMAMGLCCISTNCPCGGPQLLDGKTGAVKLIKIGDVLGLSQAMRDVIDNDELSFKMGILARERANLFKPDVIYEEWNHYLSAIVNEH